MIPLLSSFVLPLIARKGLISGDMKRRPSGVAGRRGVALKTGLRATPCFIDVFGFSAALVQA